MTLNGSLCSRTVFSPNGAPHTPLFCHHLANSSYYFLPNTSQSHGVESWVPVKVCTCPVGILMLEGAHQMANWKRRKKNTMPGGAKETVKEKGKLLSCFLNRGFTFSFCTRLHKLYRWSCQLHIIMVGLQDIMYVTTENITWPKINAH